MNIIFDLTKPINEKSKEIICRNLKKSKEIIRLNLKKSKEIYRLLKVDTENSWGFYT